MKKLIFAALTVLTIMTACDDTTDGIGLSLTSTADRLDISVDTFTITTQSVVVDSVLSRSATGYLGRAKDPETEAYYTNDYTTQFGVLQGFNLFPYGGHFLRTDSTKTNGKFNYKDSCSYSDACDLRLYVKSYYGDSLTTLKATAYELDTPLQEGRLYYSNFNPQKEDMIRTNGLVASRSYSIYDRGAADTTRAKSTWLNRIVIPLSKEYIAPDGQKYSNIGSYILRMYQDNPEYFKNSYTFIHNVLPGFYIKHVSGIGAMAEIYLSEINIHYKAIMKFGSTTAKDSTSTMWTSLKGTDEVVQGTCLTSDKEEMTELAAETNHTYIKGPASIFTEVTLPVEEIFTGHESDPLNSAKIILKCLNSDVKNKFSVPTTLLIVQKDKVVDFFENAQLADSRTSFLGSYSSTSNIYTFNNICTLVQSMYNTYKKATSGLDDAAKETWKMNNPNWNKCMLVPVKATYSTYSSSSILSDISNDMSLTSVMLVGGPENDHEPIKISVVYSKFNE